MPALRIFHLFDRAPVVLVVPPDPLLRLRTPGCALRTGI